MNKTEKLLAARKRLKEFQLSKKSHVANNSKVVNKNTQDHTSSLIDSAVHNPTNEACPRMEFATEVDQISTTNHQILEVTQPTLESCNSLEFNTNHNANLGNSKLTNLSIPVRFPQDTIDLGDTQSTLGKSSNISNFTNQPDNSLNKDQSIANLTRIDSSSHQITPNWSNITCVEPINLMEDEIGQTDPKPELPRDQQVSSDDYGSLVGSQAVQKEYLLQMTSAVTSILTNDSEGSEIPQELTSDLEQRNRFLASCLDEQKKLVNQLHIEVSQYKTRLSELEVAIATKDADFEAKLYRELNPLKEQLQLHAQATGILVGEKAELTAALAQSQMTAKEKIAEVEELNGKLKSLQIQLCELEKELNLSKHTSEDVGRANHQLESSYNALESKYAELKQERDDLELETAELKQKLNVKNTELTNIEQELKEKNALLSLNELRLQQMTSSPQGVKDLGEQHVVAALEQQLSQLMETLKAVSSERDEASNHYQNYVQQLNTQVTTLALKLEQTTKENAEISAREHSLIQRLSDLEQQIQNQKEVLEPPPPVINNNEQRNAALEKSIDQLVIERDSLQVALHEKDSDIEVLKQELEELQEMRQSNAEASRLASALEGERLAAARAVSQNQQLKQQLSEMQDAFVQLSNAKLDLTEQLQGERAIGRKLNACLNDTENNIEKLKNEIQKKDLLLADLEKEKLQAAQIADQMQHYQAQSHHAGTLQQELHNAQERIETLTKTNQQLISELNAAKMLNELADNKGTAVECVEQGLEMNNGIVQNKVETSMVMTQTEFDNTITVTTDQYGTTITPEAVKKLEERFKDTMERLAELADEKQRLEHLVLQLQSETETIGEYVTLYQNQRGVLQQRAKEKEETFRQLTEQLNQQQEQLHKLKMLVMELLKEQTTSHVAFPSSLDYGKNENDQEAINHLRDETQDQEKVVAVKDNTTSQILDLLTEIKDCKDTCALEPNFHPCPWCSGKLITI